VLHYRAEIMAELPRWAPTNAEKMKERRLIRVDLRRSLEMHLSLALGLGLAGAALAGTYLLVSWPSATAQAHNTGVILNAGAILLAAAVIGVVATIVAHHLDPRIHVAADVEHLLGIAPLAQMPDFSEVSEESAQEHLAVLAKEIAQVCSEGSVRRCVFTGTGIGAGVTTIAAKTKEALRSIGRASTLVDAAWATPGAGQGMGDAPDEGGIHSNSLILTDTLPIAESPDAEFLARFADCVIVVVESGVTTRQQLKATALCLGRLNLVAVGFVVNRVRQMQSASALRETLKARRSSADGQSVRTRKQFTAAVERALAESPKSSAEIVGSLPGKPPAKPFKRSTALTLVKRPEPQQYQSTDWSAPGVPPWLTEALTKLEAGAPLLEQEPEMPIEAVRPESDEREAEKSAENAVCQPEMEQVSSDVHTDGNATQHERSGAMLFEMNWMTPQPKTSAEQEPIEAASSVASGLMGKKISRLSALRGKVSAADLKALNHGRVPEANELPQALIDALSVAPERLSNLRGLVTPADLNEMRAPPGGASIAAEHVSEAGIRADELAANRASGSAQSGTAMWEESPAEAQVPVEFPKTAQSAGAQSSDEGSEATAKAEELSPKQPASASRDERANYGDVQILPSKRGQYRRKK
jgi:Mrp family chromosome partitioning ATPase